jgi:hypothetical protein
MKTHLSISILIAFYISLLLFTNYSIIGIWSNIIISISALVFSIIFLVKKIRIKTYPIFIKALLIYSISSISTLSIQELSRRNIHQLLSPFNLTSFYLATVEDNLFNACFLPVGAFSGGEGNLIIYKSLKFLPIIESPVYYKHAVTWDYSLTEWEGVKLNQREIIINTILQGFLKKPLTQN